MIIGVTGGFGTGKSFVASAFRRLGAKVVDADKIAHDAMKKGTAPYRKIVAVFGRPILGPGGVIDRKVLGKIVFSDEKRLGELERIVHPAVLRQIKGMIGKTKKGVLVVDAPLIYEAGLDGLMDMVIVVRASRENQIKRCAGKFGLGKAQICKRMACQIPLEDKMRRADRIVDNNGTRKETAVQVKKIWLKIKKGKKVWR